MDRTRFMSPPSLPSRHRDAGAARVRIIQGKGPRRPATTACAAVVVLAAALAGCAGPQPAGGGAGLPGNMATRYPNLDPAKRLDVVMTAMSLLETDYRYGGARPLQGFDCSGLVQFVFAKAGGVNLPHNTAQIAAIARTIPRSQLRQGDLVFFNTLGRPYSHMGIYLGGGRFINAPSSGGQVRIDNLNNPYYQRHYEAVKTLFAP